MSLKTVIATVIGLAAAEAILSSSAASGRVGSALQGAGVALQYLLSPGYPLVPDLRLSAAQRPHPPVPNAVSPDSTIPTLPPVEGAI